ncbi:phage portal protein [Anaeroselena agilis]|uniref:Phage portal protein n=1 Tax=Anaeroselena agilis TaxID=3063788 RepID=A0ABU3NY25_9FIRM|nr:phage portal protein [Selenomonadales bacterium 4137-cl]
MDPIAKSFAEWLKNEEEARMQYYEKCQAYFDGVHPLKVPEKYRAIIQQAYGIKVNYCAPVVEAPVARLKIEGITCEDKKVSEALTKVWKYNRMDAKATKLHRNAIKKGDAFAQVWPHFPPGSAVPDRYEIKFLSPDNILPIYSTDDAESLTMVRKQWISFDDQGQPVAHKWLFYPDRIERWHCPLNKSVTTMTLNDFARLNWQDGEPDGFPPVLPNPYGYIPIIHFRNREDDNPFGTSELHDAMTIQDGINKLVIDLIRTADFQAFKQRYVVGVEEEEIPVNPESGRRELSSNPGDVWRFPGAAAGDQEVTVGELAEQNPDGILKAINDLVDHLCAVTRTPRTALQESEGTASSGFALSKVEAPLIDKVKEKQTSFGNSYEDINRLLIAQMQYHGDLPKGEIPDTEILWAALEAASPQDKLFDVQRRQILKQNKVISAKQWAIEEGYSEEEIAAMQADIQKDTDDDTAALLGHAFDNNPFGKQDGPGGKQGPNGGNGDGDGE